MENWVRALVPNFRPLGRLSQAALASHSISIIDQSTASCELLAFDVKVCAAAFGSQVVAACSPNRVWIELFINICSSRSLAEMTDDAAFNYAGRESAEPSSLCFDCRGCAFLSPDGVKRSCVNNCSSNSMVQCRRRPPHCHNNWNDLSRAIIVENRCPLVSAPSPSWRRGKDDERKSARRFSASNTRPRVAFQ